MNPKTAILNSPLFRFIWDFFNKGHERTVKAKKNIVASFMIKGVSILIGFVLIPLLIHYLDKYRYGIWITISSIVNWMAFFDIGFGNGLRNKLAEALALGDKRLARKYVSTTYIILTIIFGSLFLVFLVVNPFLDWSKILNTPESYSTELRSLAYIVFGSFVLRFIFQLINIILTADQRPAFGSLFGPIGNVIVLVCILIVKQISATGSLLLVGTILCIVPVLVLVVANLVLFRTLYREFIPSLKFFDKTLIRSLMNLGVKFFIIQASGIVLVQSTNIIITQLFDPSGVTVYNIGYSLFNSVTMVFSIIMVPMWSANTEAFYKGDLQWIRNSVKKLLILALVMSVGVGILILCSNFIYRIWIGRGVTVPFVLTCIIGITVIRTMFASPFISFLNGVGKIKLSMSLVVLGTILHIPLSIFLVKVMGFGIEGIVVSALFCDLILLFFQPLQYMKIMKNTAKGIWNR